MTKGCLCIALILWVIVGTLPLPASSFFVSPSSPSPSSSSSLSISLSSTRSCVVRSNTVRLSEASSSSSSLNNDNDNDNDGSKKNKFHLLHQALNTRAEQIQVEKTRTSLEEQNTRSFLKRRPIKLPYEDSRRWVQANLGCDTKEEFDDMVANGNLRTPYIPKRPEEWYKETREWISWEHFLKGHFDNANPSAVKPPTGIFD